MSGPGCVTPKDDCPHVEDAVKGGRSMDVTKPCSKCGGAEENWVCLTCFEVHCGRYQQQHMQEHCNTNKDHCIVASFADLSFWCYLCEAYITHPKLSIHYSLLMCSKFSNNDPDRAQQYLDAEEALRTMKPEEFLAVTSNNAEDPAELRCSPLPKVFEYLKKRDTGCGTELVAYSPYEALSEEREAVMDKLAKDAFENMQEDRLMGCFMGMVCGDSLGAPMEFKPVRYEWSESDEQVRDLDNHEAIQARFQVKGGQWTDDSAMGLCLADSLIEKGGLDLIDLKLRFVLWWETGYCNAFGADLERARRSSVGLGGSISHSFSEFMSSGNALTRSGDSNTSGNGSLMRNAAIPLFYHSAPMETALESSRLQSLSTHQGREAADLARLLTFICIEAANHESSDPKVVKEEILGEDGRISDFDSTLKSVDHLMESEQETETEGKHWDLRDRDWRWRVPAGNYKFAPSRAMYQPDYVGSYAMDCMAMALHVVWCTDSLEAALLKAANQCGDADTVAAVAGQIAGSIYGCSAIPKTYLKRVSQWDNNGDIPLRAHKLIHRKE